MTFMKTPSISSKLPQVGTTIFSVMSALAQEQGAVNLGQGFPDFEGDPNLIAAVHSAMQAGHNQYPPMAGVPVLRERIAQKIQSLYGYAYDPVQEITVTAGATQAILTAILCAIHPGDEVIVIEPAYDSYLPSITLAGGKAVSVPMMPPGETDHYRVDWRRVEAAITPRTRMILINSPHNPTGMILRDEDLRQLALITRNTDILILADEVYEHMVYDGQAHVSVSRHPELAARSFVISSFGKTFHVTGWKVAYCAAPAALMQEFRKVHQFNVFTVNTPMQHGIASYLQDPAPYVNLPAFYQRKRDLFRGGLQASRFKLLPCDGTYFQLADYSAVSSLSEMDFCRWLTTEIGVAAIPVSSFYQQPRESGMVRFCFAKQDQTLLVALERLVRL
jgi:methionine aminotransferase